MNLFDKLVNEVLKNRRDLSPLRLVVEKELLHHDILRILSDTGLLARLTFIGGTCLRMCYGSNCLSEDLDFTGGTDFTYENLSAMSKVLIDSLRTKYGLHVDVSDPIHDDGKVKTWKLKVQTQPRHTRDFPTQRIHIDVCTIPSYQAQPMMLLNPYGVEIGTSGLILQAESREEIFTDKLITFAMRNRIKNRDLWDIMWLYQQNVKPLLDLIPQKLNNHGYKKTNFLERFNERLKQLVEGREIEMKFRKEMRRFLPADLVSQTVNKDPFWNFLTGIINILHNDIALKLEVFPLER